MAFISTAQQAAIQQVYEQDIVKPLQVEQAAQLDIVRKVYPKASPLEAIVIFMVLGFAVKQLFAAPKRKALAYMSETASRLTHRSKKRRR